MRFFVQLAALVALALGVPYGTAHYQFQKAFRHEVRLAVSIVGACGESLEAVCVKARRTATYGPGVPDETISFGRLCDGNGASSSKKDEYLRAKCEDIREDLQVRKDRVAAALNS